MRPPQIAALGLGAAVVAVGAGLVWHEYRANAPAPRALSFAAVNPAKPEPRVPATPPPQQTAKVEPAVPEAPVPPPAADLAPTLPQFDTVRVEPSGDTVVAGHGAPGAQVALLANGKPIANEASDGAGNFVIIPTQLAPGNYNLTLRTERPGKPAEVSVQVVTVSVPARGQKNLVVAVAEPGKPTRILADTSALEKPMAPPVPGALQTPSVSFKTAEVDKDGFYATGTATPPGEHLRIYLNGTHIADLAAAADDHWSLTVKRGLSPGHYILRADALDGAQKVSARAEVGFDVPLLTASAAPTQPHSGVTQSDAEPTPAMSAPGSMQQRAEVPPAASTLNDAVVPTLGTATVIHGDSLWRISRKILGHGVRYTLIYEANASQIRDPNLIYPGQVFVVPPQP
ncbi:MAG: LysM peptidoglycan-binding domain-containing protein [Methylovirgula sp.]|uniref:LysM peptidoglycan-binding domain-containing protein n=1 Tax=Methylovirgula sp. TaxID=1978224 RepID=UPI0030762CB5